MEPIPVALPNVVLEYTTGRTVLPLLVALSVPAGPAGAPALRRVVGAPQVDIIAVAAQLRLSRVTLKYVRLRRRLLQELQIQSVSTQHGVAGVVAAQAAVLENRCDMTTVGRETPNLVPQVQDAPVPIGVGGPHAVVVAARGHNSEHVTLIGNNRIALVIHAVHLVIQMFGAVGQHAAASVMALDLELMIVAQHKLKPVMYRPRAPMFPLPTINQVAVASR